MEVTINYNGQALSVEVTVEVYEYLDRADHKTENLAHEQRRHWDGREFDEYIAFTEGAGAYSETPEEYLCRNETLNELLEVLARCTDTQQHRFLLYALEHSPSPEELLMFQEEQAARNRLLSMLDEALSQITPVQARRVRSYYLQGLNFPKIAQTEGVNKDVVCRSVHAGLKRLQEYYRRQNRAE